MRPLGVTLRFGDSSSEAIELESTAVGRELRQKYESVKDVEHTLFEVVFDTKDVNDINQFKISLTVNGDSVPYKKKKR